MNIIDKYIKSQQSLHLYKDLRKAIANVLHKLDENQLKIVTNNLIIMALHENANAQVMHFENINNKFVIMQINIHNDATIEDLEYVFAHELGHVMQGRNWQETDGDQLEVGADNFARLLGYQNNLKRQA